MKFVMCKCFWQVNHYVPGVTDAFESLQRSLENLNDLIKPYAPVHRPIDIQTTDAGPGVGTSEDMVRLRLT